MCPDATYGTAAPYLICSTACQALSDAAAQQLSVNVLCLQDNVALIAVLETVPDPERSSSKQLICVANTHIHANPELNDVKLWQVHTLLKGLEKIANRYYCTPSRGV